AVAYAHQRGVKVYVTVNNSYFQDELEGLAEYLQFLQGIAVDALIIQDLAVLRLARDAGIDLPLHASVQMGIANHLAVQALEEAGVARVILSKNLSLEEIAAIRSRTALGLEYFVHGDLCVSHAGQCVMSALVCGESGNRGRCRKPCRWPFLLQGEGLPEGAGASLRYWLAHKDLSLWAYLAQLAAAGVTSFKIEGRMRDAEFLAFLVGAYRQALDALCEGRQPEAQVENALRQRRVRDFTTGSLFGPPGPDSVGLGGEREPHFPTRAVPVPGPSGPAVPSPQPHGKAPRLAVGCGSLEHVEAVLARGVGRVIVGGESFRQYRGWSEEELREACRMGRASGAEVLVEGPRCLAERFVGGVGAQVELAREAGAQGFVAHDLGTLRAVVAGGMRACAGYGLNVTNAAAAAVLRQLGAELVTGALELRGRQWELLAAGADVALEAVVHGPLTGMISDYCPVRAALAGEEQACAAACARGAWLTDELGQRYEVLTDQWCRAHVLAPRHLCLLGHLDRLRQAKVSVLRIEGHLYGTEELVRIVDLYLSALDQEPAGCADAVGCAALQQCTGCQLTDYPFTAA
ncbi:MAG: U32 family peptidase, partial [Syntrophomonadaceae bacterium]|nr:U32 family peptidase [Syntrophomonadaceae bacterium]